MERCFGLIGLAMVMTLAFACDDGKARPGDDAGPVDAAPDVGVMDSAPSPDVICGPGLTPHVSACVPTLDSCKQGEVPVPGGGCKAVGVETCSGGLKGPAEPSCTSVGVEECTGGLKGPAEPSCTSVGVEECPGGLLGADGSCTPLGPPTTCSSGWATTSGGWCEPVLPTAACPGGTLEQIGSATCQAIGDCGSGTYGAIQTGASTIFVDQGYAGPDSDGSQAKPFKTIGAALKVAAAGAQIAVAAGTYAESLSVQTPLALEGRCAEKVVIQGQAGAGAAPALAIGAKVTLRGLSVTGPQVGIRLDQAEALIEQAAVQSCGGLGLLATKGSKLTLKHSVVAGNHGAGVEIKGATADLDHVVLRDNESDSTSGLGGEGVRVSADSQPSTVTITDSVVNKNRGSGVSAAGSTVTIERSVVNGTRPRAKDNTEGSGIGAASSALLTVKDSVVSNNQHPAVSLVGAEATLERTVVRDTRSRDLDKLGGTGIQAVFDAAGPAKLTLKDCLLHGNRNVGVAVAGSDATLERTVVRYTKPQDKDGKYGIGLQAGFGVPGETASTVTIDDCLFADNHGQGLSLWGAKATVRRTVVRGTEPQSADGKYGTGIKAGPLGQQLLQADLTVQDCLVQDNSSFGVELDGAKALLERTVVRDTRARTDKKYGIGVQGYNGADMTVKECLVVGNRQMGISLMGCTGTVERSIVRDTAPQLLDKAAGYGIAAEFYKVGSVLSVKDSLVANNTTVGVSLEDASATIEGTVVRDTRPKALDLTAGDGIQAIGEGQAPSVLTVKECLVSNNRNSGISVYGTKASIERTIVQDTGPRESDRKGVAGVEVRAWLEVSSELTMKDSLVSNNRGVGLQLCGSSGTVERTVVRDSLPRALDGIGGHGIVARRIEDLPSTLELADCEVASNRSVGIAVLASTATVDRTVVRETRADAADNRFGIGIQASLLPDGAGAWTGDPSSLTLRDSLVSGNRATGISVASSKATVERCIVRETQVDGAGNGYGDGIQAVLHQKGDTATLEISDTLVESSVRSGLFCVGTGGQVQRSVFRKNVFAVVLDKGADPTVTPDVVFEDNSQNKIVYGQDLDEAPLVGVPSE